MHFRNVAFERVGSIGTTLIINVFLRLRFVVTLFISLAAYCKIKGFLMLRDALTTDIVGNILARSYYS